MTDLQQFLGRLDERHLAYAWAYADQLAVGDPAPSAAGLDRQVVRQIRERVWREWRRRIDAMPGSRR